jgi:F0F1-type ATP synthase membrane subunit b/b'
MIPSEQVISITFRLINFAVLIGLIAYLFKSKVLSVIRGKIGQKRIERQERHAYQQRLQSDYQDTLVQLEQDKQQYIHLRQAIDKWHHAVIQENAARESEKNALQKRAQERVEDQERERVYAKTYAAVLKESQVRVEQQIAAELMQPHISQQYFLHLINSLGSKRC